MACNNRLSSYVQRVLRRAPCDGTVHVFGKRRHTRLGVVCRDGNGVRVCARRLHRGRFVWPRPGEASWQLSGEKWQWLVAGGDWQRLSAPPPAACG